MAMLTWLLLILQPKEKKIRGHSILDDKKMKDQMMERYAFIDVNEDKKQYKPAAPKSVNIVDFIC
jgi:hypothetical protein